MAEHSELKCIPIHATPVPAPSSSPASLSHIPPPLPPVVPPPPPQVPSPLNVVLKRNEDNRCAPVFHVQKERLHHVDVSFSGVDTATRLCQLSKADDGPIFFLSVYRSPVRITQNGPRCGIVAIAMAASLKNNDITDLTDRLFAEAKAMGITKQGELFSVTDVQKLIAAVTEMKSEIISTIENKHHLVQHLLEGQSILIPYDCDKNHEPCLMKGHNAHWVLLTGCMLTFPDQSHICACCATQCSEYAHVHRANQLSTHCATQCQAAPPLDVYVYAHHGKSSYVGVWTLDELLKSNHNLTEVGPDRDSEDYVVPSGGIQVGLHGQAIVIFHDDMKKN